jgi:hypothetical protein
MFNRTPNSTKLQTIAGQLRTRADQLDREGKHGAAMVERKRAEKIERKALRVAA